MYNTPPAQLAVVSALPAPTSNLPNYSTNIHQKNEENVDPNDQGMYLLLERLECNLLRGIGKKKLEDKGQLISKCPFGVFKSTKKPRKFL